MLSQNIPPTFFPRFILAVLAAMSAALVATGWSRKGEPKEKVPASVFLTAALITGLVALVPRLGMLSTVCLSSIVLPLCWGQRRVVWIALLALCLPLGIYLLFVAGLGVRFPEGLLP